jgi:hypothetical protein
VHHPEGWKEINPASTKNKWELLCYE